MKKEYEKLYLTQDNAADALLRLMDIVRVLRRECPWDKVQTHESLTRCMVEEAYEAVEAIENGDKENLREELGDVLLQVVFHSILSEETDDFDITQVINEECEKMIRRHPHIFLEENAKTIDKVLEKWDNVKSREHEDETYTDRLRRVPKALPALIRSSKVQSKASKIGFDWADASGALDKLAEELQELEQAYQQGDMAGIKEEFGDLLFSMVNVSRYLSIDAEDSLNASTAKFICRFASMEDLARQEGRNLADMSIEEMDGLWNEAKRREA